MDSAVPVVPHHHAGRVARQAAGRFCGNARAALENRLARNLRVGQHRRVDVDYDLVALARNAGFDAMVERALGEQDQRVSLFLGQ